MGWVHAQDRATGSEIESVKSGLPMDIEKGVCYLVKEKKPEVSYRLFEVLMEQKLPGIIISRQHPKLVRREHGFADVRIIWLSHTPGEDFQSPAALGALAKLIRKFDHGFLRSTGETQRRDAENKDHGKFQTLRGVHRHHLDGVCPSADGLRSLDFAARVLEVLEVLHELPELARVAFVFPAFEEFAEGVHRDAV